MDQVPAVDLVQNGLPLSLQVYIYAARVVILSHDEGGSLQQASIGYVGLGVYGSCILWIAQSKIRSSA